MTTYRVRTTNHGRIGGFSAEISADGGATWLKVPPKNVGGCPVSFDNKAQAIKAAEQAAKDDALRRAVDRGAA